MNISFKKVEYSELTPRQQENYSYQKMSAVLAEYGFYCLRLSDDWQGADFIAQHIDGEVFLKIQLKSRLGFYKKYCNKDIWIAFFDQTNTAYCYPHDKLLRMAEYEDKGRRSCINTQSWKVHGGYTFPTISEKWQNRLAPYILAKATE